MWKPKFIYESLPYIYALVALFAIFIHVTLGRVSGFLLLIAAIQILKMRYDYRKFYKEWERDANKLNPPV